MCSDSWEWREFDRDKSDVGGDPAEDCKLDEMLSVIRTKGKGKQELGRVGKGDLPQSTTFLFHALFHVLPPACRDEGRAQVAFLGLPRVVRHGHTVEHPPVFQGPMMHTVETLVRNASSERSQKTRGNGEVVHMMCARRRRECNRTLGECVL